MGHIVKVDLHKYSDKIQTPKRKIKIKQSDIKSESSSESKKLGKIGGRRPGSGRPKNTGFFGEETVLMRIPESFIPTVIDLMHDFVEKNNLGEKAKNHLYEMEGKYLREIRKGKERK